MTASASAAALSAPPDFPDPQHVPNGCYLSAVTFAHKFQLRFPGERSSPLAVTLRNADGRRKPHTVALVTWHGAWWGRDEYFGVFPTGIGAAADPEAHPQQVERALEKRAAARPAAALLAASNAHGWAVSARRDDAIRAAESLLPFPASTVRIASGHRQIPFLFFRPAPGRIAVYDPIYGTASALCSANDQDRIVATVAARFGYRADPPPPRPAALAYHPAAGAGALVFS